MRRNFLKKFLTVVLSAALLVPAMDTAVLAAPKQFGQEEEEAITARMNDAVLECTDISYLNSCLAEKDSLTGKSVEGTIEDKDSLKKLQWNVWHPDSLSVQYTYGSFSNEDISTVSVSYNRFMSRLEEIAREEQEKAASIWEMPETSTNEKRTNAGLFKEIDGVIFWYNSSTGQWVSEEDLEYGFAFDF